MTKPWIMDAKVRRSAKYSETHLALKREVEADRIAKRSRKKREVAATTPELFDPQTQTA